MGFLASKYQTYVKHIQTRQVYNGPRVVKFISAKRKKNCSKMIFEQKQIKTRQVYNGPRVVKFISAKDKNFWSKMIFEQKNKKNA